MIGAGLIGGSFALALKRAGAVVEVVGIGRRAATLERARELGVIDRIGAGAQAVRGCDLVMLAMPVGQTGAVLRAVAPHLDAEAIVTDAGSTKADVVEAARAALGGAFARFVPGHPVAGAELSGPDAARAGLFERRHVILTPVGGTSREALARVRSTWESTGARVSELDVATHDAVLASISHLPHALAFALVEMIAARDNADQLFGFAAGGFRDFTRIASSHPEMWRDIFLANRGALLAELDAYGGALARLRALVAEGDGPELQALFERARAARNAWLRSLEC